MVTWEEEEMTEQVIYLDRFKLLEGKREEFTSFANEITEFVRDNEPGAVSYHYFLDQDDTGTAIFVFADAEAVDRHLELASSRFGHAYQMLSHSEIELLGTPSESARQMTTSFNGTVKPRLVGFSR